MQRREEKQVYNVQNWHKTAFAYDPQTLCQFHKHLDIGRMDIVCRNDNAIKSKGKVWVSAAVMER